MLQEHLELILMSQVLAIVECVISLPAQCYIRYEAYLLFVHQGLYGQKLL